MSSEDTGSQSGTSFWTPDLELGVPIIDGQHKNLILRIQALVVTLQSKRSRSALRECLRFLEQYTNEHFHTEERFIAEQGFPDAEAHKKLHDHFRDNITKAGAFIQANPDSEKSMQLVKSLLVNWYVQHIKGVDRKYIEYLRARGIV